MKNFVTNRVEDASTFKNSRANLNLRCHKDISDKLQSNESVPSTNNINIFQ